MLEKLKVGLILKPQGIKGELKVQPLTDDVDRFKALKKVTVEQTVYKVASAKRSGNFIILALLGVDDRNNAELLRGKYLEIDREDAVTLEEGRYFIADVIGCRVYFEDQKELGEIIDVFSARTDVITVKTVSNKIVRFPFLKDVVMEVNVSEKTAKLNKKRYLEVCCYED